MLFPGLPLYLILELFAQDASICEKGMCLFEKKIRLHIRHLPITVCLPQPQSLPQLSRTNRTPVDRFRFQGWRRPQWNLFV